jgi:hypothetical protein
MMVQYKKLLPVQFIARRHFYSHQRLPRQWMAQYKVLRFSFYPKEAVLAHLLVELSQLDCSPFVKADVEVEK